MGRCRLTGQEHWTRVAGNSPGRHLLGLNICMKEKGDRNMAEVEEVNARKELGENTWRTKESDRLSRRRERCRRQLFSAGTMSICSIQIASIVRAGGFERVDGVL